MKVIKRLNLMAYLAAPPKVSIAGALDAIVC
jgi:hypothetical protein